jgi:hypothetical protein
MSITWTCLYNVSIFSLLLDISTERVQRMDMRRKAEETMRSSKTKGPLDQSIKDLVAASQDLARRAEQEYSLLVDAVITEECREPEQIEHLLDGLLDFCFDSRILLLYKKLCRYYFDIDPVATAEYINAYREIWDSDEDENE